MNRTAATILGILVLGGLIWWLVARNNDDMANGDNNANVACTLDAKLCPDGSYVGREGPNCEFRACPNSDSTDEDETVFDKG
jgi:hypothetical protein